MRFASFFTKLAEMMERLAGHLGYVIEYGERFIDSPKVQSVGGIRGFMIPLTFCFSYAPEIGSSPCSTSQFITNLSMTLEL